MFSKTAHFIKNFSLIEAFFSIPQDLGVREREEDFNLQGKYLFLFLSFFIF